MATKVNRVADSLQQVLVAVHTGCDLVRDEVSVRKPPAVQFEVAAIVDLNGLERVRVQTEQIGNKIETVQKSVTKEKVYRDGELNQINIITVEERTNKTVQSPLVTTTKFNEDSAVGVVFEVPGPDYEEFKRLAAKEQK